MVCRHWSPPLLAPTAVACSLPCPACAAGAAHCSGVESWARAAVRYLQSTHWYLQYLHTDIFSIYTLISRYLGCYILCLYVPWPHVSTGSMSAVAACPRCEDARRQCWHDHGAQLVPAQPSAADAMFPGRVQISTQISIDIYTDSWYGAHSASVNRWNLTVFYL